MLCVAVLFWIHHCGILVSGHGRLLEPAGRSSMWRFGYDTPVNYNDNQLFCGGYRNTVVHDGKCGVCGDPFQGPFENEAGGKYATGTIVRYYDVTDQYINVTVDISAHHRGQFEFRLCPNNDVNTRVTQECLDQHVLQVEGGQDGGIHFVPAGSGIHHLRIGIPRGLVCSQCVLQWKYTTGNFWGVDKDSGRGCIGCGDQERFVNCADIAIGDDSLYEKSNRNITKSATYVPHHDEAHDHTSHYRGHFHGNVNHTYSSDKPEECNRCYALPTWQHFPDMDNWCDSNCKLGNCPPCRCYCGCPKIKFDNPCVGRGEYDTFDKMAGWCWRECCESECPIDKCACSETVKYPSTSGYVVQKQFFDVPSVDLFPDSKNLHSHGDVHHTDHHHGYHPHGNTRHGHRHHGESRDTSDDVSNSSEDDSNESESEGDDDNSDDDNDDSADDESTSVNAVNIQPPGHALTQINILTELGQRHPTNSVRKFHPINNRFSQSPNGHISSTGKLYVLNAEDNSAESSNEDVNSDSSRLNSFVLSEVRVMKVNKPSKKKNNAINPVLSKGNFLSRFTLREVHRTKVNKTSPNDVTSARHLSVSVPQFLSLLLEDKTTTGLTSGRASTLASTKSPPPTSPGSTKSSLGNPSPSMSSSQFTISNGVPDLLSSPADVTSSSVSQDYASLSESRPTTGDALSSSGGVDVFGHDGTLTAQTHQHTNDMATPIQTPTQEHVTDVSVTRVRARPLVLPMTSNANEIDFLKKMAIHPRLLSAAMDLRPSLHEFVDQQPLVVSKIEPDTDHHITDDIISTPVPGIQDHSKVTGSTNGNNGITEPEINDKTEMRTVDSITTDNHVTTEGVRKEKDLTSVISDSSAVTQILPIAKVSDKLQQVSKSILDKKMEVDNFIREETNTGHASQHTKSFSYHNLNIVEPDKIEGDNQDEAPYVIDARLLNQMLNTVQSWINHPMFVVN